MPSQGFLVAEFSDGIQVIPKSWLQSEDLCKYPSHYKTDSRIRKAIEKEETPTSDWSFFKIVRIFGEYSSLRKADEKAKRAIYTSDMDTDKEAKRSRKLRAKKVAFSSSESEEESCADTDIFLPSAPCPPKRQRLYNSDEPESSSSITCSGNSAERNNELQKAPSSSSQAFSQDVNKRNSFYARNEEAHNNVAYQNRENISSNRHDGMEETNNQSYVQDKERRTEKKDDNLNYQASQGAIIDHLRRLTREITSIKYDMRQTLSLLDILVKKANTEVEARNTLEVSFEDIETRFPLQTREQLMEVEDILQQRDSQYNVTIRTYIKSIGGTDVNDAVKRTLYKIFSNELAKKYNWEGRHEKEPLHKLKLIKVIFSCVLQNVPNTDHSKIQKRIMEWFRHSTARHQNEEKRKTRNGGDGGDNASMDIE